jgi:hypothetical protein
MPVHVVVAAAAVMHAYDTGLSPPCIMHVSCIPQYPACSTAHASVLKLHFAVLAHSPLVLVLAEGGVGLATPGSHSDGNSSSSSSSSSSSESDEPGFDQAAAADAHLVQTAAAFGTLLSSVSAAPQQRYSLAGLGFGLPMSRLYARYFGECWVLRKKREGTPRVVTRVSACCLTCRSVKLQVVLCWCRPLLHLVYTYIRQFVEQCVSGTPTEI